MKTCLVGGIVLKVVLRLGTVHVLDMPRRRFRDVADMLRKQNV